MDVTKETIVLVYHEKFLATDKKIRSFNPLPNDKF